ncbi:MAG: hypothetical protein V8R40_07220 [Dysosmobacter sp.]
MRKLIFTVVCLLLLTVQSQAVELPEDFMDAAPEEAEDLLDGQAVDDAGDWLRASPGSWSVSGDQAGAVIRAAAAGCGGCTCWWRFCAERQRASARGPAGAEPRPFCPWWGPSP